MWLEPSCVARRLNAQLAEGAGLSLKILRMQGLRIQGSKRAVRGCAFQLVIVGECL